ncbi:MAG: coniferyl aldehyde dehydrogenase [Henriciella sp.]
MQPILDKQKAAHIGSGGASAAQRIEWLTKAIDLLVTHKDALHETISQDFGHRPKDQSALVDTASAISALKHSRKHLTKWMRPEKRRVEFPLSLLGSKAEVHFEAKGVVGIISPWNFPVLMVFGPLANVMAAGNRAMIKPSEFTPKTSALLKTLFDQYYDEAEFAVVTGGPDVGADFTRLAFDHLVFTGSTSIGRKVMTAAAENLVPVTLELGGKSPVILGASANLKKAVKRIMAGKTLNAGQICLAPDYVFVPEGLVQDFIVEAQEAVAEMFSSGLKDNADYTSIINQRHYDRLQSYLVDAREKGAEVIELNPTKDDFSQQPHHKLAPRIIVNPSDEMMVMQDEIFGPILPVKTYTETSEPVEYINQKPRPLALYYFGENADERDYITANTSSGGVTLNDVIFHGAMEDLPFGGIGASGIGCYHGYDGFLEFSNKKSIYKQTGSELLAMLRPPYGDTYRKQVSARIKR